jgi:membrane protease YdiL (CAAX protease family)
LSRGLIGPDLRGGFGRKMFATNNPAGLWRSLAIALGLLVFNQAMQIVCGLIIGFLVFGSMTGNRENFIDATLAGILPAALLTLPLAWRLARIKGGRPRDVLNLRWPDLRFGGWIVVVGSFFVGLVLIFSVYLAIVQMTGHDTSTAGMVENALSGMARQPLLFLLAVPSVVIGAPLAEELIFR